MANRITDLRKQYNPNSRAMLAESARVGNAHLWKLGDLEMKATVGRIVHFYNTSLSSGSFNGIGRGPYAAIVTQTFEGSQYANLKILPPFNPPWDEGSVEEWRRMTSDNNPDEQAAGPTRYWVWPPRDESPAPYKSIPAGGGHTNI